MIMLMLLTIYASFHFYLLGGTWGRKILTDTLSGTDQILLGLMLHYVIVGLVNIFFPVGLWTTMGLTVLLLLTCRSQSQVLIRSIWTNRNRLWLAGLLLLCLSPYWTNSSFLYDHYLYHDQTVKWFNAFPVPAGLVNLHGRLGFNQGFFPIVSSFQWDINSHWYFINEGLFLLYLYKCIELLKRQGLGIWTKIGIISFTCFLIIFAHPYLSSISPDLQVTVLLGYLMITAAADGWTLRHPAFILSILVFMVVTKVNMTPFAIMTGLAVVWLNRRESRLFAMLIMPVCIGLVWVVRSLILTGQLLYPFPAIHFDFFSFGVPLDQVKEMHDMIVGWARSPGPGYLDRYYATATNFKWVSNWYDGRADHAYIHWPGNIRISIKMFLWLSIGVILCSVIWLVFNKKLRSIIGVIILAFCTNLVFWFLTGPDFRFASPIFNAFFCVVLVSGVGGKLIRWVVLFFLMLTLPFQLKDVMRSYMKMPGQMAEADWWHGYTGRVVGKAQMIEGRIPSATGIDSLRYFYPKEGDQSRLDVFPAATNRLEGLVFERDMRSIVFRVR